MSKVRHTTFFAALAGTAGLFALAGAMTPAAAQQFLSYGRGACNGTVTVDTAREPKLVVGSLANIAGPVASNKVVWRCDNQPPQTFECAPSTNIVQIDRRQGGASFSIICLRR